jgi:hypothetical protein
MKQLQEVCNIIKDPKHPEFYLAAMKRGNPKWKWGITAKDYIKESTWQLEKRSGMT